MAAITGEHSGIQPPLSDGEEEIHTSPSKPPSGWEKPHKHLQANLGDLTDNQL